MQAVELEKNSNSESKGRDLFHVDYYIRDGDISKAMKHCY